METAQDKRPEIMKVLEMLEAGKIEQDKALAMIAMLEGKDVIGGPGGVIKSGGRRGKAVVLGGIAAAVLLGAFVYGLFFYLPVHATNDNLVVVYGLLALMILCGTLLGVSALGIGRLAVKNKKEG